MAMVDATFLAVMEVLRDFLCVTMPNFLTDQPGKATACAAEPYTIPVGGTLEFNAFDGSGVQSFALTSGSRTNVQLAADLAAATGVTVGASRFGQFSIETTATGDGEGLQIGDGTANTVFRFGAGDNHPAFSAPLPVITDRLSEHPTQSEYILIKPRARDDESIRCQLGVLNFDADITIARPAAELLERLGAIYVDAVRLAIRSDRRLGGAVQMAAADEPVIDGPVFRFDHGIGKILTVPIAVRTEG